MNKPESAVHSQNESRFQPDLLPETSESISPQELERLLAELKVKQIQLELQNEELRRTQTALEASKDRYFDLYELAPVGYITASEQGLILESNLTACNLLGVTRESMTKAPLSRYITTEYQDRFYLRRRRLFKSGHPQSCELYLRRADQTTFPAHLDACLTQGPDDAPLLRITITDMTGTQNQQTTHNAD